MDADMLFSIGEMAKLCHVTPKTLRYYSQLGLLKPAMINPNNGYRFFTKWHITRVLSIKQLQDIGMSLEDIQKFFQTNMEADTISELSKILDTQEENIISQINKLQTSLNTIKALQTQCAIISRGFRYEDINHFTIREIQQRKFVYCEYQGRLDPSLYSHYFTQILSSIQKENYKLEEVIISAPLALYNNSLNKTEVNMKLGYEVSLTSELPFQTFSIKEGMFACYTYKGKYEYLNAEFFQELCFRIRSEGYKIQDPVVEYFYVNEALTDEKNNYLTEIQFPINS